MQETINISTLSPNIQVAIRALLDCDTISTENVPAETQEDENMKLITDYEYKIFQSGDRWYCTLPNGKRIKRKRKEDVEKVILEIQMKRRAEKNKEKDKEFWTAAEIFREWQDYRLEKQLAIGSTALRDSRTYDQHLKGTGIAAKPIRSTTCKEWTAFLQDILDTQHPTSRAYGRIKGVVKVILEKAEDEEYIDFTAEDVINHVRVRKKSFAPPEKKDPESEVYSPEDLAKLKDFCMKNPNPYTRCIMLAIITGTRPGECAPLRISDVDLDRGVIRICQTETRADEKGKCKETVRSGAKTDAGMRDIVVPASDMAWLRGIVEHAKRYSDTWLFPQEPDRWKARYVGNRIRSQQLRRRLKEICEDIGIKYRPPHKFRKTYASILRSNGVSDEAIKSQMGHVDIKTTEEVYIKDRQAITEKAVELGKIAELSLSGDQEKSPF